MWVDGRSGLDSAGGRRGMGTASRFRPAHDGDGGQRSLRLRLSPLACRPTSMARLPSPRTCGGGTGSLGGVVGMADGPPPPASGCREVHGAAAPPPPAPIGRGCRSRRAGSHRGRCTHRVLARPLPPAARRRRRDRPAAQTRRGSPLASRHGHSDPGGHECRRGDPTVGPGGGRRHQRASGQERGARHGSRGPLPRCRAGEFPVGPSSLRQLNGLSVRTTEWVLSRAAGSVFARRSALRGSGLPGPGAAGVGRRPLAVRV
jgi:hypothetical protein